MKRRNGFTLLVVVLLMAVGSALLAVAASVALNSASASDSATLQRRALVAAETEAWTVLGQLRSPVLRAAPVGRFSQTGRTAGDITLIATVDKVDNSNVWIVAVATVRWTRVVARHRIGLSAYIPGDTADVLLRPVPVRGWAELF